MAANSSQELLTLASQGDADAQAQLGAQYISQQNYVEAVKWLHKSAGQGSIKGQTFLGYCYEYGFGVAQNYAEAVKLYKKSAEMGDAVALKNLGDCYVSGHGTPQDYSEAIKCYSKSAALGHKGAREALDRISSQRGAVPASSQGNASSNIQALLSSAVQGNTNAQFDLGRYYLDENDNAEAVKWFRKAADSGHVKAQVILGLSYRDGDCGLPQNYTEAVKWLLKAAKRGEVTAQYSLGQSYEDGEGVQRDYVEAAKWYRKAAEQGYAWGQLRIGAFYEEGWGVPQDYSEAVKWYQKAANQGDETAQYNLGVCWYNGNGVPKDESEAIKWFRKAAEQGNNDAKSALNKLGADGGGCYVATAVYGSYNCPQVWTLRRFRDYTLAKSWYGRLFVHTYYAVSPTLVELFGKSTWFNKLLRPKLDLLVARLQRQGISDQPYEDRVW